MQGEFETALFHRIGEVRTAVAGRTDAGVHAAGQVISFTVDDSLDIGTLQRSLNSQLRPEIAVYAVSEVPGRFPCALLRYRTPVSLSHLERSGARSPLGEDHLAHIRAA